MDVKKIALDDGTHIEIEKLADGTYQAAWIDSKNPGEALAFGTARDEAGIMDYVTGLLAEIPPFIAFDPGDKVVIRSEDQYDGMSGTVEHKVTHIAHVMEPRYVVKLDGSGETEQFRVSELEG